MLAFGRSSARRSGKPLPDSRTEVTLRNFGYGDGEDWAKAKAYFANAWPAVMDSLEKRFAKRT